MLSKSKSSIDPITITKALSKTNIVDDVLNSNLSLVGSNSNINSKKQFPVIPAILINES